MDQDHFRQFLSTSSKQPSSSSSARSSFGSNAPKRTAALFTTGSKTATSNNDDTNVQKLAPRLAKKKKIEHSVQLSSKQDDYSNAAAAKLLEELQQRGGQNTVQDRLKALEAGTWAAPSPSPEHSQPLPTKKRTRDEILASLRKEAPPPNTVDKFKPLATESFSMPTRSPPQHSFKPVEPDVQGDEDIFGDAGEYEGLDGDSSDSERGDESEREPSHRPVVTNAAPQKYFEDIEDEARTETSTRATLDAVTKMVSKQQDEQHDDDDKQGERLQPLSSSAMPSVRDILEADKQAEADEKRKAKKAKWKAKQGDAPAPPKELSAADKANKDFTQMQNYLKKRDKAHDTS